MPTIQLETTINAPIDRVFDLARSIDLHKLSAKATDEEAIAGKTNGLIGLGESVTWKAKHFGIYQKLKVRIVAFDSPYLFEDVMVQGAFKQMKHKHLFATNEIATQMTDVFEFTSPFGLLGTLANIIVLKRYMTNFLLSRNRELKRIAESEEWRKLLT